MKKITTMLALIFLLAINLNSKEVNNLTDSNISKLYEKLVKEGYSLKNIKLIWKLYNLSLDKWEKLTRKDFKKILIQQCSMWITLECLKSMNFSEKTISLLRKDDDFKYIFKETDDWEIMPWKN